MISPLLVVITLKTITSAFKNTHGEFMIGQDATTNDAVILTLQK